MRPLWTALENLPSLSAVREAAKEIPRKTLLEMLQWNDPNGCYLDDMSRIERFDPLAKPEAEEYVVRTIDEAAWPADDPRRKL